MNKLRVSRISKSYGSRLVVKDVSFEVLSGQVRGLLGPNGAGKTTSFHIVVGLLKPDQGEIYLNDQRIDHLSMFKRSRAGLGYLPQESSIFRRITVEDNIKIALNRNQGLRKREREEQLDRLLENLQIQSLRNSYGGSLSGGERRRVEIARSLALFPKFILFDEPFAGVDPITIESIQKIISELKKQNVGILITDHNVRETLKICDYALILKNGEVEVKGKAQDVASSKKLKEFYLGENFKF